MITMLVHGLGLDEDIWSLFEAIHFYKVEAFELPGHGKNSSRQYSWEDIWENLNKDIKKNEGEKINLVLHSFSSAILPEVLKSERIFENIFIIEGIMATSDLGWTARLNDMDADEQNRWFSKFKVSSEITLRSQLKSKHSGQDLKKWSKGFRRVNKDALFTLAKNLVERVSVSEINKTIGRTHANLHYIKGQESGMCSASFEAFKKTCVNTHVIPCSGHFPMIDNPLALNNIIVECSNSERE